VKLLGLLNSIKPEIRYAIQEFVLLSVFFTGMMLVAGNGIEPFAYFAALVVSVLDYNYLYKNRIRVE
jgi:hypothetical protein